MIKIFVANLSTIGAIRLMLERGVGEAGEAYPIDYDPAAALKGAVDMINHGLVFVAVQNPGAAEATVIGTIMCDIRTPSYAPHLPYLESQHFYVVPEARKAKVDDGKLVALALIEAAKALAQERALPLRVNGFFNDDRGAAREALFEKQGFRYMGANFAYIPPALAKQEAAE